MSSKMKNELLKQLFDAKGEPVSGQDIADQFGLSRTAIWKYVKELEKDGYEITSVRKKGYVLQSVPDKVNAANIQKHLKTNGYGQNLIYFDTCTSTQIIAHEEAQKGVADGTVVIAEEQTKGKGRLSRYWDSKAGKGIWMRAGGRHR